MMLDEMSRKKRWVELQNRGYSNDRIAELTNSDPKWIRHFLTRNNLKALERMAKMRAAERAKQVLRLEEMIHEAYRAWDRDNTIEEVTETIEEPTSVQTVQQAPGATAGGYTQVPPASMALVRTKTTRRYKVGNINYLKAVQGFMTDIRAILKIDDGTRRVDLSLNIPGQDSISATLDIKQVAAAELQAWNEEQRDRLKLLLDMPEPEIIDPNGEDPELTNGDQNGNNL